MLEWIIPAVIVGAGLIPKGKMSDERKIQAIFENRGVGIKKKDRMTYPRRLKKYESDGCTTLIYTVPLGIDSDTIKKLPIAEALNKDVEFEFDGIMKIDIYHHKLPEKWNYNDTLLKPNTWLVPIGKNHTGLLYHDFEKYPHMLCGGVTRFGKTVFIKNIFHSILMNQPGNVEFYFLDLKGGLEFSKYIGLPQVKAVASDVMEAAVVLDKIVADLKKKEKEFRQKGYTNIVDTPIQKRTFIIVDEGAELSPDILRGEAKQYAKFCQSALSEIARIGGGLGLRLLYCTQYPSAKSVDMSIKMNIVTRISFIAAAQVASRVILDEIGAEDLPSIPGRAIYKVEKNRVIQVPYIDDKYMIKQMEEREDEITGTARKPVNDDRHIGHE